MATPTPTLPNDEKEAQDSRYNPGEQINQEKMGAGVSAGIDQAEAFANDPENASNKVKEQEENPDAPIGGLYQPSGSGGRTGAKKPFSLKGVFKKKGPTALIATLLFGGGGLLSFMFTPALGLVNMKEVLMGDLNDQLSAYSLRSDTLLRTKIDDRTRGFCSNSVKIRCQFTSMSTKQIDRFKRAGFTDVQTVKAGILGRERIVSMKTPSGAEISDPQDLRNLARDPAGRTLMLRAFNPVFAGFSDAVANKTFRTLGISKASWFDRTKGAQDSARSVINGEQADRARAIAIDPERGEYIIDPTEEPPNDRVYKAESEDRFNQLNEEAGKTAQALNDRVQSDVPGKAVAGVLTGAIKGVGVLGVVDSGCTVYNTARAVSAAAKTARALQLAQFSMMYLNTADAIKAGTATPEEVEFLGKKLSEVDTTQTVIDETQAITAGSTPSEAYQAIQPTPNPNFGKNAYGSAGYGVAAFGDTPVLDMREQQYMTGGGLTGSFSGVTNDIAALVPGGKDNIRSTCGVIQSWWVRGAGLVVGAIAAIGTGGISLAVSIGGSAAIALALPFLEAALVDIIKGEVVGPDTDGVDAGNAIFAGTAEITGQMAKARGLRPLTEKGAKEYFTLSENVKNDYIAAARFEAKDEPLNIMNQYSFLGSFARALYTPFTQMSSSLQGFAQGVPQVLSLSVASIFPNAQAETVYNPDRFNKCQDEGYEELGIAADIFCNVRYGLSPTELALDPVQVLDYMLTDVQGGHITSSGLPKSQAYKDFIEYCVEREDGWGETGREGSPAEQDKFIGSFCMEDSTQLSNFRVYTLDKSVVDAMDEVEPSAAGDVFDIVSPVSAGARITSNFGPRTSPCDGCSSWHAGVDFISNDKAVFSIMEGEVIGIGGDRTFNFNNVLQIRHPDGLISTYWHMKRSDITVVAGQTVAAGERVGTMGTEGYSTGIHLHIELDISGVENIDEYRELYTVSTGGTKPGQKIDPLDYLQKNGVEGF